MTATRYRFPSTEENPAKPTRIPPFDSQLGDRFGTACVKSSTDPLLSVTPDCSDFPVKAFACSIAFTLTPVGRDVNRPFRARSEGMSTVPSRRCPFKTRSARPGRSGGRCDAPHACLDWPISAPCAISIRWSFATSTDRGFTPSAVQRDAATPAASPIARICAMARQDS